MAMPIVPLNQAESNDPRKYPPLTCSDNVLTKFHAFLCWAIKKSRWMDSSLTYFQYSEHFLLKSIQQFFHTSTNQPTKRWDTQVSTQMYIYTSIYLLWWLERQTGGTSTVKHTVYIGWGGAWDTVTFNSTILHSLYSSVIDMNRIKF